ncbi:MAG: esterase-like activity of phytase family protein [Pseudomonadota bacterium]
MSLESHVLWPADGQGLSGLIMAEDGGSVLVVSDRGRLFEATLERGDDGEILAIVAWQSRELLPPEGTDWPDTWLYKDSEGLAAMPDGRIAVSYEGLHRIALHERDGTFRRWFGIPDSFEGVLAVNEGFEAVAATQDGLVIALPEAWPSDPDRVPIVARRDASEWDVLAWLPVSHGFAPVGLDIDEQGRFYLLERRFHMLRGFSSRLRRFVIDDGEISQLETLLETRFGRFGNLEGLSLWRRADGTLIAAAIADNNENRWQARDMVEWALPD